jgi:hypothetical protein
VNVLEMTRHVQAWAKEVEPTSFTKHGRYWVCLIVDAPDGVLYWSVGYSTRKVDARRHAANELAKHRMSDILAGARDE